MRVDVVAHVRSCRDRHCPNGQREQSLAWQERQRADVLPVTYHHAVFTLPSALRAAATGGQLTRVTRDGEIDALLDQLMQSECVVFSKACPGRAEQVVDYLAHYSHRIAISDPNTA